MTTTRTLLGSIDTLATAVEDARPTVGRWADAWRWPGGLEGLVSDVTLARAECRRRGPSYRNGWITPQGPSGQLVSRMWLRQIPAAGIATMLDVTDDELTAYLARTSRPPKDSLYNHQIVWERHCAGDTVTEIEKRHGVPRSVSYKVIEGEHAEPNRRIARPADESDDAKIIRLYRAGKTYTEITKATGISLSALKRYLARLRDSGDLPEYGTRPGGRPTSNQEQTP